ncbi:AaceriAEL105Wp [[Ashbya] aceris (nom. inval.)]|nr:AaceriAEL105Wp [[Ashbya] aceris (nom. inval.)]
MVRGLFGFYKKSGLQDRSRDSERKNSDAEDVLGEDQNTPTIMSGKACESVQSSSIFSRGPRTCGTDASTSGAASEGGGKADKDIGKPLRVTGVGTLLGTVAEQEEISQVPQVVPSTHDSRGDVHEGVHLDGRGAGQLEAEIQQLRDKLDSVMDEILQNVTNVSKAVIQVIEHFKNFLVQVEGCHYYYVSIEHSAAFRRITKIVLHFQDNLLQSDVFSNSRAILLRWYMKFLARLNLEVHDLPPADVKQMPLPSLKIYAIGQDCKLPNRDKISSIIEEIAGANDSSISDQEGAFIAPVLRGLNKDSAILTILFGFPKPQQAHYEMVNVLYSLFRDVHFYCVKDYITPCAANVASKVVPSSIPMQAFNPQRTQFIPPYKLPSDVMAPPMSMSLSSEDSVSMTGTLGGYLFPQIPESEEHLSGFAGSAFGITCAHVVLTESQDHPYVSVPSRVLQNIYKKTLKEELTRYPEGSIERLSFEEEITRIEQNLEWQLENKFGQVVWGERSIIKQKLSDFAIIKLNPKMRCRNYLGDDLSGIPDPVLRFKNLHVRKKLMTLRPGLEVFKIGASSKYTRGIVNGSKIVYWADGKIQSTEFVISSPQPFFATGGDSGAWLLTKLDGELGLGVVGMLHSYDGERKQFGLYTPIADILERLHDVTGVIWDIDQPPEISRNIDKK